MCHLEEPRAHFHPRPKALSLSHSCYWPDPEPRACGVCKCITYDTVKGSTQTDFSVAFCISSASSPCKDAGSEYRWSNYLGSPWVTGKSFRVVFISSIPLQSLRAPSPLSVLGCLSLSPARVVVPAFHANLLIVCFLIPFWSIALSAPPSPVSFWTETHCIATFSCLGWVDISSMKWC